MSADLRYDLAWLTSAINSSALLPLILPSKTRYAALTDRSTAAREVPGGMKLGAGLLKDELDVSAEESDVSDVSDASAAFSPL